MAPFGDHGADSAWGAANTAQIALLFLGTVVAGRAAPTHTLAVDEVNKDFNTFFLWGFVALADFTINGEA
jgi:hypothetical protein